MAVANQPPDQVRKDVTEGSGLDGLCDPFVLPALESISVGEL